MQGELTEISQQTLLEIGKTIDIGLDDWPLQNSHHNLAEAQRLNVPIRVVKTCGKVTKSASNGKRAIRDACDLASAIGAHTIVAEGDQYNLLNERDFDGLRKLQEERPDIRILVEGPVYQN